MTIPQSSVSGMMPTVKLFTVNLMSTGRPMVGTGILPWCTNGTRGKSNSRVMEMKLHLPLRTQFPPGASMPKA